MSSDSIVGDGLAQSPYEEMKASRDHFRDCISAREVRRIVDERDRLRAERDEARELLRECREDWIAVGYRASPEDLAAYRDVRERIDAALKDAK